MSQISVYEPSARVFSASATCDFLDWVNIAVESGLKRVLVDLRNVMFMDSYGLNALVTGRNRIVDAGGELVVCSLSGQTKMLFELTTMDRFFVICPSRREFEQSCYAA